MRIELGGFAAFIACGNEEVPCYGIEKSEDGKEAVCWIASEVGKVCQCPTMCSLSLTILPLGS